MEMTAQQLQILRHMLGIDTDDVPNPPEYRDYFCANVGDPEMMMLRDAGMVHMYRRAGGYEWWATTDRGKEAARASQRAGLKPKPARVYARFLDVADALPGLTFREFLTNGRFAEHRRSA